MCLHKSENQNDIITILKVDLTKLTFQKHKTENCLFKTLAMSCKKRVLLTNTKAHITLT